MVLGMFYTAELGHQAPVFTAHLAPRRQVVLYKVDFAITKDGRWSPLLPCRRQYSSLWSWGRGSSKSA